LKIFEIKAIELSERRDTARREKEGCWSNLRYAGS